MPSPSYPPERVLPGAMARLMSEDWHEMTARANRSPNHVNRIERWAKKALEANPSLTPGQAERLGEMLRTEHYRKMGRLSAQARKLAKQASTILAEIDEADAIAQATPHEAA